MDDSDLNNLGRKKVSKDFSDSPWADRQCDCGTDCTGHNNETDELLLEQQDD